MPRPSKPYWDKQRQCWRTKVDGIERFNRDLGPRDKAGAARWLQDLLASKAVRAAADPRRVTVAEICERYLEDREGKVEPVSLRNAARSLTHFCGATRPSGTKFGSLPAAAIGLADVQSWLKVMAERGAAPRSAATRFKPFHACWRWAEARSLIPPAPWLEIVDRPTLPAVGNDHHDTRSPAFRRFRAFAWRWARSHSRGGARERHAILFAWLIRFLDESGARPIEAQRLEWGQIDWDRGAAFQKHGKTTAKTGRAIRLVISPRMARILKAIDRLPGRNPQFVFTSAGDGGHGRLAGTRFTPHQRVIQNKFSKLRDAAIAAGVPIPPGLRLYDYRHAWITRAILSGVPIELAAKIANTGIGTIERTYLHVSTEELIKAATSIRRAGRSGPGGGPAGPRRGS